MAWQHLNLRIHGSMYFQTKYIKPLLTGEPVNEKRLATYERGLVGVLDLMEQTWLKGNPYVAGKDLTIADLLAVTELEQPGAYIYHASIKSTCMLQGCYRAVWDFLTILRCSPLPPFRYGRLRCPKKSSNTDSIHGPGQVTTQSALR